MGLFKRLTERLSLTERQQISKLVTSPDFDFHRPKISFAQLITYYETVPQIQLSVDSFHISVVGEDIIIKAKDPEDEKILNEYASIYNLYQVIWDSEKIAEITGNCLIEKVGEALIPVDMSSVTGIDFEKDEDGHTTGKIKGYIQTLDDGTEIPLPKEKFLHLPFKQVRPGDWALSMFYPLAVPRGSIRDDGGVTHTKPLIDTMILIEDAMGGIFVNMANPLMFISYPDANRQFLEDQARKIQKMKPGDKIVGDRHPEIKIHEVNPTGKFDSYVKHLEEAFMMGTGFSYEIFLGRFTSRASSETTESELTKNIQARKRFDCNFWKQVLESVLMRKRPDKYPTQTSVVNAGVSITFKDPNNVVMAPSDIKDADYLTTQEKRQYIRDSTSLTINDDDDEEPTTVPTQTSQPPDDDPDTMAEKLRESGYVIYKRKR